jgi:negative regulator of flagellin synthesis FlgM
MQIYGPSGVHGAQSISAPHSARRVDAPQQTSSVQPQDEVQISSAADFVAQTQQLPDVRSDRIASIRAAIADGTYETSDKLSAALDGLLNEIG